MSKKAYDLNCCKQPHSNPEGKLGGQVILNDGKEERQKILDPWRLLWVTDLTIIGNLPKLCISSYTGLQISWFKPHWVFCCYLQLRARTFFEIAGNILLVLSLSFNCFWIYHFLYSHTSQSFPFLSTILKVLLHFYIFIYTYWINNRYCLLNSTLCVSIGGNWLILNHS